MNLLKYRTDAHITLVSPTNSFLDERVNYSMFVSKFINKVFSNQIKYRIEFSLTHGRVLRAISFYVLVLYI